MKTIYNLKNKFLIVLLLVISTTSSWSQEQTQAKNQKAEELDEVVVLGSRRGGRTSVSSLAPVDVLSAEELATSGFTQTIDAIQSILPSFTSQKLSLNDGTDYIRPASIRGLGPEHVLVLVNGKRRHTNTLVHVNGQTRGSVAVDLNAIPISIISRIEVLRDGASAQYGSDAIAGVINIILKKSDRLTFSLSYGSNFSWEQSGYAAGEYLIDGETDAKFGTGYYKNDWATGGFKEERFHTDGGSLVASIAKGFNIGKNDGIINLSLQFRNQDKSNRAGKDPRMQYFGTNAAGDLTTSANDVDNGGSFDSKEASFNRLNHWYGKSQLLDFSGFINGEIPTKGGNVFYFNGGGSYREGLGPCYYRRALDNRTVRSIYPDGFLPQISPIIIDGSFDLGYKGKLYGEWRFDVSSKVGYSGYNFRVKNTHNTSLGALSHPLQKQTYDDGTLASLLWNTNVDLSRDFDINLASPLYVAIGAEFRYDNFNISKGEEGSYINGNIEILDGPNKGGAASAGCQCFPGYNENSETSKDRTNVALYLDLEADIVKPLTVGLAGRFENYSDFGSTLTGKLSLRWQLDEDFALRSTLSTGFRAPALAQSYYASIATAFTDGALTETGTFPVDSKVAKALGAKDLKAETSTNFSLGLTIKKGNLRLTIDGYYVSILDRVVLSENFTGKKDANSVNLLKQFLNGKGISARSGRYFTNALNTATAGLDIVSSYKVKFNPSVSLNITLAANFNETKITNKDDIQTPDVLTQYSDVPLIGRQNRIRFENFSPRSVINLSLHLNIKRFGIILRNVHYGHTTSPASSDINYDLEYPSAIITSLEFNLSLGKKKNHILAIGSDNLLDIYPLKQYKDRSFNGIFQYDGTNAYGFTGRYVYARFSLTL